MIIETAEKPAEDLFTGTAYANSPEGWWTPYGGALDAQSGVVRLPGPFHPPSPFHSDECHNCGRMEGTS
ncbi:hypothetical protein [Streptomyces sp. DH8]|uniref:hypothetical protein n=1 Tax=Streptomyces sp. DH8 TaxID=2857008 RepID=UPI001E2A5BD3|nr:hypothetical protein [Streptomyces sp. DH8]